jgi:hypothetical protein
LGDDDGGGKFCCCFVVFGFVGVGGGFVVCFGCICLRRGGGLAFIFPRGIKRVGGGLGAIPLGLIIGGGLPLPLGGIGGGIPRGRGLGIDMFFFFSVKNIETTQTHRDTRRDRMN